jgi:hypothetical protein
MLVTLLVFFYNLTLLIGTVYLVNSGWSIWTFVLTALFLMTVRYEKQ